MWPRTELKYNVTIRSKMYELKNFVSGQNLELTEFRKCRFSDL